MTTTRITLIAAALGAALLLAAAHASGATTRSLTLSVTQTKISTVDVPPLITSKTSSETPGDEILAVSTVRGASTGHRYLVCSVTKKAASIEVALYACQVTYVLAGGTVTAAGVVHLNGRATAAVTGGTGAYAGARGTLVSTPGRDVLTLS